MSQLTKEDREAIKRAYRAMDENGDGRVSMTEVKRATKRLGIRITDSQLKATMGDIDKDDDGYLDFKEFEKMLTEHIEHETIEFNLIRQMFQRMDVDGDGKVTCSEIEKSLKISKAEAKELILEADTNGDGKMSFDEFVTVYRGQNG